MSINFTAKLVQQPTVKKHLSGRRYMDLEASIVELDVNNPTDMEAIMQTERNWMHNGGQFIHHYVKDTTEQHHYVDVKKEHYLALTSQKADFNRLKSNEILGVLMFTETKLHENEISWLEVRPDIRKGARKIRDYKEVGSRLTKYVLEKYKNKDIFVQSALKAIPFYKKMGAVQPINKYPQKCLLYFRV